MSDNPEKRVMLVILDGWGHSPDPGVSAIARGHTPVMDALYANYPHAELTTFGLDVGLPVGQMGNSEVGHLNIGAGRIVDQELVRIGKAIRTGTVQRNAPLLSAIQAANERQARIHLMGLLSDGGVHSHIDHLKALCDVMETQANVPVYIHAFTDGRDVDPHSGVGFVQDILSYTSGKKTTLSSVIGRYYAMDRDKRWERTKKAYDMLVRGTAKHTTDLAEAVQKSYADGVTDEFILPLILTDASDSPVGTLRQGDLIVFFNFRTDRPRQLVTVLSQRDFPEYEMRKLDLDVVTMNEYDKSFTGVRTMFETDDLKETLGEVLSLLRKTQLRIAETEKYPHVTYFFSGGREQAFDGEERVLIPSPKVPTYDMQPEMSAFEVTDAAIKTIDQHEPDFICLNYANPDMVGHTGVFSAAVRAVETIDACLGRLLQTASRHEYATIIIADHGNADTMINPDGSPNTAHTMNPVPVILVSKERRYLVHDGKLADIAPTILFLMGIEIPAVMTGNILLESL